ncbi:MAG: tetratricopeptide repeat protein [Fulvivirga sp.]
MKGLLITSALLISFFSHSQNKLIADSLYQNQAWPEAITAYQKHLKKSPSDSAAWFNTGMSHLSLKNYPKAMKAFKEASKYNYPAGRVYLALAKTSALTNDLDAMYEALEKGAESGLAAYAFIKSEPAFSQQLNADRFLKLLNKIKLNAYPCLSAPNYRHFDFWLGAWDVFANGIKAGVNVISMAEGGCAIHENYTTAGNYSGQSINYYDPIDEKWHQHWVGSGGDVYNYLETKRDTGMLQFKSKYIGPGGQISLSRLTFTLNDDGTVRQLFESSTDEGRTWAPAFDGLYKKQNNQ